MQPLLREILFSGSAALNGKIAAACLTRTKWGINKGLAMQKEEIGHASDIGKHRFLLLKECRHAMKTLS